MKRSPVCRWCGKHVVADAEASYGVIGVDGSLCCDERVQGCPACDDGEAHPHEARARSKAEIS